MGRGTGENLTSKGARRNKESCKFIQTLGSVKCNSRLRVARNPGINFQSRENICPPYAFVKGIPVSDMAMLEARGRHRDALSKAE